MFWSRVKAGIDRGVRDGVTAGLEKGFAKGGPVDKAMGDALAPIFAEMNSLRRTAQRYQWHPIEGAPDWIKDGRTMLVSVCGDLFFACYSSEPGEEPYWDADVEYGGTPIMPDHWFPLPRAKVPAPLTKTADGAGNCTASTTDAGKSPGTNP